MNLSLFALKNRDSSTTALGGNDSSRMKPKDTDVELANGGKATSSFFDLEAMIFSLPHDESVMKE